MVEKVKKLSVFLVLASLVTYMVQSIPLGVSPVLATLMQRWPDVGESNIVLIATIIGVAALPTALLAESISRKIGIKLALVIGSLTCVVFGAIPSIIPMGYEGILITRILLGLGYGLSFPLGATVITYYFPDLTQRSKVMGWAGSTSTVSGMVFSVGAGYLATIGDGNLVWLVNGLMIVAFVFALIMPSPEKASSGAPQAEAADDSFAADEAQSAHPSVDTQSDNKPRIGGGWFFIIGAAIFQLCAYPFALFISSVIVNDNLGGSVEAGYAIMLFNIGGILGGLLFPIAAKVIKERVLSLGLLVVFLAYLGLSLAMNIILIYACMLLLGCGFLLSFIYLNMGCTVWIPKRVLARGMGIMFCGVQLANFVAGYLYPGLAGLLGQGGNARFSFYVVVVVFAVTAILFLFRPRKVFTKS
jgi:MFS family permease